MLIVAGGLRQQMLYRKATPHSRHHWPHHAQSHLQNPAPELPRSPSTAGRAPVSRRENERGPGGAMPGEQYFFKSLLERHKPKRRAGAGVSERVPEAASPSKWGVQIGDQRFFSVAILAIAAR